MNFERIVDDSPLWLRVVIFCIIGVPVFWISLNMMGLHADLKVSCFASVMSVLIIFIIQNNLKRDGKTDT